MPKVLIADALSPRAAEILAARGIEGDFMAGPPTEELKGRFMGVELSGKTLGVIGCGNVGAAVAERALGLRMKVVAYDPFLSPERARDLGAEKLSLEALYTRADFITLHTPLTEATRNLIDARALAAMKPGVRLVNSARA